MFTPIILRSLLAGEINVAVEGSGMNQVTNGPAYDIIHQI